MITKITQIDKDTLTNVTNNKVASNNIRTLSINSMVGIIISYLAWSESAPLMYIGLIFIMISTILYFNMSIRHKFITYKGFKLYYEEIRKSDMIIMVNVFLPGFKNKKMEITSREFSQLKEGNSNIKRIMDSYIVEMYNKNINNERINID